MQTTEITASQIDEVKKYLNRNDMREIARLSGTPYEIVRNVFYQYQKKDRSVVMKAAVLLIESKLKGAKNLKKQIA